MQRAASASHRLARPGGRRQRIQLQTVRDFLEGRGIEPVIPRRSNQPRPCGERFDKKTYRKRSRIECAVGWLKECRRLGTRYEKLAVNFVAFAHLAFMLKYLRILDPSDRA